MKKSTNTVLSDENNTGNCAKQRLDAIKKGDRVKHSEQNYIGVIKSLFTDGYCIVELESSYLRQFYPFGIKARIEKLLIYSD